MEYCSAGSISNIIFSLQKTLEEVEAATVLSDALKGLQYVHKQRLIHRDVKAGNILLTDQGIAKLADFGVANRISEWMDRRTTKIGTPYWMAPEVMQEIGHTCSADIWSLGITAIEMLDGNPPHSEIHPMRVIMIIANEDPPTFRKPRSSKATDFVNLCLSKDPDVRPDCRALLTHSYIGQSDRRSLIELYQRYIQFEKTEVLSDAEELFSDVEDTLVIMDSTDIAEIGTEINFETIQANLAECEVFVETEELCLTDDISSILDEQKLKEIENVKNIYDKKRAPILEAIMLKKELLKPSIK